MPHQKMCSWNYLTERKSPFPNMSCSTFTTLNPFSAAVSFWGQLGTNYFKFEWFVPKTGLEF